MHMKQKKALGIVLLILAIVFISMILWNGCQQNSISPTSPSTPSTTSSVTSSGTSSQQKTLAKSDSRILAAIAVQEKHTQRLMSKVNVVGTAVGLNDADEIVVKIYTAKQGVADLPTNLDGINVDIEVTGIIHAMGKPGGSGGGVSHTAKQTPPIQLGTSGGWGLDLANGYCCGGTLGSLVQINDVQYILSNYHVFESDIVLGGNNIIAADGNPIIQPGLIDVGCKVANAQTIATLVVKKSLPNSNVDASIAQVVPGMVKSDGSILEIGTISKTIVAASLKQAVKKSGRTTGLTRSSVTGLNATISVVYDNECAGGTAFTKTFTGQIVVGNKGNKFLNSGDSGSLMVEDVTTSPRAVGLLFAGSSSAAIANPIDQVLTFLGATMVGQ